MSQQSLQKPNPLELLKNLTRWDKGTCCGDEMPNFSITLLDTTQSVTRPNVIKITEDLQRITGIPKSAKVMFPGDIGKMKTPGSEQNPQEEGPRFASDNYIKIEVNEDYDIAAINGTSGYGQDYDPIFLDPQRRVMIRPMYADALLTITYSYKAPSKTEVTKWRDDIRMRVSQMRDVNLHSFKYHLLIHPVLFELIYEIYERVKKVEHTGDTLEQYIHRCTGSRLTLVSDDVGKDYGIAISETQSRIIGMWGFEALPEKPSREDDSGMWSISFEYRVTYNKPIGLYVEHPVMIHNELLPEKFTTYANSQFDAEKIPARFSGSFKALRQFEMNHVNSLYADSSAVIRLPQFDDFLPDRLVEGTVTILFALCELDLTDRKYLLNLKELGDVGIDPDIMDFIIHSEYPYMGKTYKSILQLHLYQHEKQAPSGMLTCDAQGNVKTVQPISVVNNNRVRLSLVYDLTLLDPDALDRLRDWPRAFVKIISALNGGLGWDSSNNYYEGSGLAISAEPKHPTYPYNRISNTDFLFAWVVTHMGGGLPTSQGMPNFNDGMYGGSTNLPPGYKPWINNGLNSDNGPWRDYVLDYIRHRIPDPNYPRNDGTGVTGPHSPPQPPTVIPTDFGDITLSDLQRLRKYLPVMKTVERTCIVALRNDLYET